MHICVHAVHTCIPPYIQTYTHENGKKEKNGKNIMDFGSCQVAIKEPRQWQSTTSTITKKQTRVSQDKCRSWNTVRIARNAERLLLTLGKVMELP